MADFDRKWIPDNLDAIRLKFCCTDCFSGGTPSTENEKYYSENEGINWIASGKVHDCIIESPTALLTEFGYRSSSTKMVKAGSPVIAMTGATCANAGILGIDACTNQSVFSYILNNRYDKYFVYYCLVAARKTILTNQLGGAQAGINGDVCKNIYIPNYNLTEQKEIGSFLFKRISAIDKYIDCLQKEINALQSFKIKRIRNEFNDSDPKIRVKFISSLTTGATPETNKPLYWDEEKNIIWVTPADFSGDEVYINDSERHITEIGYRSCGTTFIAPNSIIISTRAPIGKIVINSSKCCFNQGCKALTMKSGSYFKYYYYWFYSHAEYLNSLGKGTTFLELSSEDLNNIIVPNPSFSKQKSIAEKLDKICSSIDALVSIKTKKIDLYHKYKYSLINEVITKKRGVC